jgi:hypothetical protein
MPLCSRQQGLDSNALMMEQLDFNLSRHGFVVSEQYSGKGTAMTAAAKLSRCFQNNGFPDAGRRIVMGTTCDNKSSALKVRWGLTETHAPHTLSRLHLTQTLSTRSVRFMM